MEQMKTEVSEKKSVKTLKGQLFGAVSMMLVAAIALGTSTYAWFINNQAVEVQTMNLTVSTATSLLAAVGKPGSVAAYNTAYDAANYTSFKTVIASADINGETTADHAGWTNFFTAPMTPASVCGAELAQKGNSTAFPKFYKSLDKLTEGKVSDFAELTHDTAATMTGLGQGPVKHIRLAMLGSASTLNVYLGAAGETGAANTLDISSLVTTSTAAGVGDVNGVTPANQAAAIRRALRMAIVPVVTGEAAATPVIFQFDDGTTHAAVTGNNTYYGAATGDVTADETTGLYKAIATINSGKIATVSALQATLPANNKYVATVSSADGVYTVTPGTTPLFTLIANQTQIVDVYFWLEGTDQDCLNELSAYHFGLNLPFVAAPAA